MCLASLDLQRRSAHRSDARRRHPQNPCLASTFAAFRAETEMMIRDWVSPKSRASRRELGSSLEERAIAESAVWERRMEHPSESAIEVLPGCAPLRRDPGAPHLCSAGERASEGRESGSRESAPCAASPAGVRASQRWRRWMRTLVKSQVDFGANQPRRFAGDELGDAAFGQRDGQAAFAAIVRALHEAGLDQADAAWCAVVFATSRSQRGGVPVFWP